MEEISLGCKNISDTAQQNGRIHSSKSKQLFNLFSLTNVAMPVQMKELRYYCNLFKDHHHPPEKKRVRELNKEKRKLIH